MSEPILTYMRNPTPSTIKLPTGATDTHVHIFGPGAKFPYSSDSNLIPVDAGKETLFALHAKAGIDRCVMVQSLVHGTDNSAVEDAIVAAKGRYLGVALVNLGVSDTELKRLADVGFRGVRFHFMKGRAGNTPEQVIAFTKRLEPFGLHLQVHFDGAFAKELAPILTKSEVPVVIDHMGRVDATKGMQHEDFQAVCRLVEHPKFWIKVSGIDRIDSKPPYEQGVPFAKHLVATYTDKCVWGTDFPHPNHTHMPDDGILFDSLAKIAPKPDLLHRLLVDNPMRLYRFTA